MMRRVNPYRASCKAGRPGVAVRSRCGGVKGPVRTVPRGRPRVRLELGLAVVVGCLVLGTGCTTSTEGATGQCAPAMDFDGRHYTAMHAEEGFPVGEHIGQGVWPPCNDQPGEEPLPAETVDVSRIRGIDPSVAVAVPGWSKRTFFVQEELAAGKRPPELRRLLRR